ncbi:DoxX family protein [Aurantivibrio plasticivorans]
MTNFISKCYAIYKLGSYSLSKIHVAAALAARIYIAQVFFSAGLTKLRDWDTTLFLFEEEYHVPLLPFELAAYLGTFAELVFPVLLIAGFMTRFSALALFVVNIVAVISLAEIAPAALYLHIVWGLLLAQLAIYGGGLLSAEKLVPRFFKSHNHSSLAVNGI